MMSTLHEQAAQSLYLDHSQRDAPMSLSYLTPMDMWQFLYNQLKEEEKA